MTGAGPSLRSLVAELGSGWPDARAVVRDDETEWSRGGVLFGVVGDAALEVRLDPAVGAAALRTPDATRSSRGEPWVRFAPRQLDGHAVDRATAWFGLAYRRAITT